MSGVVKAAPTPRAWLGDAPYPWPRLDEVAEGDRLVGCYCVVSKQIGVTKNDKPYLRLQLADRSGEIEGRVWEDAERIHELVAEGDFVGVRGRIESFRGQRQLKVEGIEPLTVAGDDMELFLPRTPHDLERLEAELDGLIASVEDSGLNALLRRLLGRDTETGRLFRRAPAAKRNHHAYVGGLLEHTVSVAWVCSALARHYGGAIDRDLLVVGALLHDIGKTREIAVGAGFPYTDEGHLLGHIVIGIRMVADAARDVPELSAERALLLQHLIASHQGKYEWQSPRVPMTLEALLLHYVDDLDAKMHQALALVAASEKGWTGYDPSFGRAFLRHLDRVAGADGTGAGAVVAGEETGGGQAGAVEETGAEGVRHAGMEQVGHGSGPQGGDDVAATSAGRRERFAFGRLEPPARVEPVEEALQREEEAPQRGEASQRATDVPRPAEARSHVPRLGVDTLDLFAD